MTSPSHTMNDETAGRAPTNLRLHGTCESDEKHKTVPDVKAALHTVDGLPSGQHESNQRWSAASFLSHSTNAGTLLRRLQSGKR